MTGHVALLLPDLRGGGAQRVFLALARDFIDKGLRVDLVLGLKDGQFLSEVPPGVRLVPLTKRVSLFGKLGFGVRFFTGLVRYLRNERPEAVLSSLTGTNILAICARALAFLPIRLVVREAVTLKNLRHPLYKLLMQLTYCHADTVVALTAVMRKELIKVLKLNPERIVQIPNPVNIHYVRQESHVSLPYDFDTTFPYALAVGRLSPQKDYVTLIKAFTRVVASRPLRLVILGDGPDRSKLKALSEALSVENYVELRGFDPNPYRWMARASFFVLSSRWEGFPNVVLEARALGIPIVITEYDASAREVGGEAAVIVPIGDPQAIAHGMLQALDVSVGLSNKITSQDDIICDYLHVLGFQSHGRSLCKNGKDN